MTQFKALLLAGGMLAAIGTTAAQAAPQLSYELLINGTVVVSNTSPAAQSSSGSLSANPQGAQLPAGFSQLTFSATGVPILNSPLLNTTASISTNASFTGTAQNPTTVELFVFQSGLTTPTGSPTFISTISLNNLNGAVTSFGQTYVDPSNATTINTTPTEVQVASLTGTPGGNATNGTSGQSALVPVLNGPFSETQVFEGVFTAPNQNLQFTDQVASVVPEPASLALIGTALFGLGMIRRRRNRA